MWIYFRWVRFIYNWYEHIRQMDAYVCREHILVVRLWQANVLFINGLNHATESLSVCLSVCLSTYLSIYIICFSSVFSSFSLFVLLVDVYTFVNNYHRFFSPAFACISTIVHFMKIIHTIIIFNLLNFIQEQAICDSICIFITMNWTRCVYVCANFLKTIHSLCTYKVVMA